MKNLRNLRNALTKTTLALAAAAWMFVSFGTSALAYPQTEGKVTVDTAKIRESASTSSSVKKTIDKGATVIIVDEETDSSGTVWYKVTKDDVTGYIRSDLLEKGAPIEGDTASDTTADTQPEQTVEGVDPMSPQYAEISVDSGKMRAGASTNDNIVTTLQRGTQVVVSGSRSGSDGKLWYYVTTTDGATGYIRNDLITLGEMVPQEEPEPEAPAEEPAAEEPAAEPYVNNDFEVVYTDDGTGQNVWYLYDHQNNNRVKVEELLKYVDSEAQNSADAQKTVKKLQVALILVAILLLAAIVAIVILALKMREAYYEAYGDDYEDDDDEDEDDEEDEDEEDDDEEEDVRPVRRRPAPAPASERERRPQQRQAAREHGSADEGVRRYPESADRRPKENAYHERQTAKADGAAKKPAQRKTKNFLIDDDDFEFEFLNMDDKD